jgi:hypothetical protein
MAQIIPIQIPKTVSSPADPSAPSFLSTLPPEIRNPIYEVLFKRDGEVLLHDAKAYREGLRQALGIEGACEYPGCGGDVNHNVDVESDAGDQGYRHGFEKYIALLRTCRQIHHEAAGVLYGSNTFRFPHVCIAGTRPQIPPLEYPVRMLSSIGSHFQVLSKVSVDVQACHEGCTSLINMLPFLRLRWVHLKARCVIQFTDPVSALNEQSAQISPPGYRRRAVPAYVLNNLLVSLGDRDMLDIKRYASYSRLIPEIHIRYIYEEYHRDIYEECHGAVCYSKVTGPTSIWRDFNILDEGMNVEWDRPDSKLGSLSRLPHNVCEIIYTYACTADTDVVFDLDARKCYGLSMNILHTCCGLRNICSDWHYWEYNDDFILRTRSTVLNTSSLGYNGLRVFFALPVLECIFFYRYTTNDLELRRVTLEIVRDPVASLDDVQIDVEGIWNLLPDHHSGLSVGITRPTTGGEMIRTGYDVSMS